jgi:CRP-like cAMP-binding protein
MILHEAAEKRSDDLVRLLLPYARSYDFFNQFRDETLVQLMKRAEFRVYHPGSPLVTTGEEVSALHFILQGRVRAQKQSLKLTQIKSQLATDLRLLAFTGAKSGPVGYKRRDVDVTTTMDDTTRPSLYQAGDAFGDIELLKVRCLRTAEKISIRRSHACAHAATIPLRAGHRFLHIAPNNHASAC